MVKTQTNWEQVAVDTKIRVWEDEGGNIYKMNRYFSHAIPLGNGEYEFRVFSNGADSWSAQGHEVQTSPWSNCELVE